MKILLIMCSLRAALVKCIVLMICAGESWLYILNWFSWLPLGGNPLPECSEGSPLPRLVLLDSVAFWFIRNAGLDPGVSFEFETWHIRLFFHCD